MQLGIKYIVHLLAICCKYLQNAGYTQVQDQKHFFPHPSQFISRLYGIIRG
jgi:hypothetical protein